MRAPWPLWEGASALKPTGGASERLGSLAAAAAVGAAAAFAAIAVVASLVKPSISDFAIASPSLSILTSAVVQPIDSKAVSERHIVVIVVVVFISSLPVVLFIPKRNAAPLSNRPADARTCLATST